jgi:hypothetical protein
LPINFLIIGKIHRCFNSVIRIQRYTNAFPFPLLLVVIMSHHLLLYTHKGGSRCTFQNSHAF